MQSTNKVLCNFDQQLTELEKYTARGNLGTFGLYEIQPSSTTHTVDQTESQNGQFFFSKGTTQGGLYQLSLQLYISPDGTKPNESIIPLWIGVRRNYSGGSMNSVIGYTTNLTRLEQNGPWQCRIDIFQMITNSAIMSMDFIIDFEEWKIPQGTPVECRVSGVLIGNIIPIS